MATIQKNVNEITETGVANLLGVKVDGKLAVKAVSELASAAQGTKADSAVQPEDLATVATSGVYNDLSGKPTLGTAASTDSTSYATAAQGTKADSAVQPEDLATVATSGAYNDLSGKPTLGTAAALNVGTTASTVAAGDDSRIVGAAQKAANLSDLANATTAKTNLGLAAVASSGSATDLITGTIADARLPISMANKTLTGTTTISGVSSAASNTIYRNADNSDLNIWGGTAGSGANVQLFGSTHAAFANQAFYDSASHSFRGIAGAGTPTVTIGGNTVWHAGNDGAGSGLDADLLDGKNTGRSVGNVPAYEDFGGFPTFNTDSRIIFRKPTPTNSDVYNVGILRNAPSGGTAGFVNSALRVTTTVDSATSAFEWAGLFQLDVNAAGGGEHCALYAQATKDADGSAWSLCTELRETTSNPTTGSLGIEVGMFVTGTDSSEMRHGIDISIGSANNGQGTNIVSSAIRIGPSMGDPLRAQLTNGIQLKGRITAAIDMTQLDISYSDVTVKMPTNGKISWRDTNQTVRGELAWNSTITSWQISGVLNATSATAGGASTLPATPAGYMHIQINGTMRKVPYYAA